MRRSWGITITACLLALAAVTASGTQGSGEGRGVFPPPGTKRVKRGIIVPKDFALPPGYVRHYQTTDDGRQLPAILMFSPDFKGVDKHGRHVTVPADRIVPPEMAPPGLPIRMLDPTDAAP